MSSVMEDVMASMQKAKEDGDDVAVDSMQAAMDQQTDSLQYSHRTSEREEWLLTLDQQYIRECTDVDELHKVIEAMQEEGFIGLQNAAENRLSEFQKKVEAKVDTHALFDDLAEWEMVSRREDNELRAASQPQEGEGDHAPTGGAPVRKGGMVRPAKPNHVPIKKEPKEKVDLFSKPASGTSARHTYDNYQSKWDKWDNSNFIEEVLEEEAKKDADEEEAKKNAPAAPAAPSVSDAVRGAPMKQPMSAIERKIMADKEKEKGNECFKIGEHDTAIEYYTRGLELQPNAIIYANRAMAYIRIKRSADAIKDCDAALRCDPSYTKALFRRGLAHKELKVRARLCTVCTARLWVLPGVCC